MRVTGRTGSASRPRRPAVVALAVMAAIGLITWGIVRAIGAPAGDRAAGALVAASGTGFVVAGEPFRFVGFNLYDAAAAGEDFYHCTSDQWPHYTARQLDAALGYMHDHAGATVLRFWAYQTYTRGGTDWSGIDEVIALARRHGMRVLPVLEDGPGYCTTGPAGVAKWRYQGDTWYSQGYKVPYGDASLSYRDYVKLVVSRYAGDPAVFGWEMVNEATTSQRIGGASALVAFARDIGSLIHSLDPGHLVALGGKSDGNPGASGPDFVAVSSLPQISFTSGHDYAAPGQAGLYDPSPLNGDTGGGALPSPSSTACRQPAAPLACSVADSLEVVHKPVVIDEVGIPAPASSPARLQARAALFDRKLGTMFGDGVSGVVVWDFNKVDDTGAGDYDVLASAHDPLVAVLNAWSKRI